MQCRADSDKDTILTFSHPKYLIKKIKCVQQTVECYTSLSLSLETISHQHHPALDADNRQMGRIIDQSRAQLQYSTEKQKHIQICRFLSFCKKVTIMCKRLFSEHCAFTDCWLHSSVHCSTDFLEDRTKVNISHFVLSGKPS